MIRKYILALFLLLISQLPLVADENDYDWDDCIESANECLDTNNSAAALEWASRALSAAKNEDNIEWEQVSESLSLLFKIFFISGDYEKALEYAREDSLVSFNNFGDKSDFFAEALTNIGDIYYKTGDYGRAYNTYAQSLAIRRSVFDEDSPALALSVNNMAIVCQRQGKFEEAKKLYEEALAMRRRLFSGNHPDLAEILNNYAKFLVSQGDFEKAGKYYKEAFDICKKIYKGDHPNMAQLLNNLGEFYYENGNYSDAEPLFEQALEMRRRLYPGDHPDKAYSINKLAEIYDEPGSKEEAGKLYKEALDMRRRLFIGDHPDLWESINNMALYYLSIADVGKAEPLYIEALEMTRRMYKGDHPDLAMSINNTAYFYQETAQYEKAEPLYVEALGIYRRLYKGDHIDIVTSLNNLAEIYKILGKYDQAGPLYMESVEMARRIFPSGHPNLAMMINNLAHFLKTLGRYDEAEPLFKESLEMFRHIFKSDHPFLAKTVNNLGALYNTIGKYSEAEKLYKEAIAMYRRLFKEDNSDFAKSINALATFYKDRGKYAEAEPLYKEALNMTRRLFKTNHPQLALMLNNMARFYEERGLYKEAGPLYEEALEITRFIYKNDHPDLATSINSMALFYSEELDSEIGGGKLSDEEIQTKIKKAETLFIEALEMRKRLFKGDHPGIAASLSNLALFRDEHGDYDKAGELYKQALEMRRRFYGSDHPNLANSISNLGAFYMDRKNYKKAEKLLSEALEMNRRLYKNAHPDLANSINIMARYYHLTGQDKKAEYLYIEALSILRTIVNNYFPSLSDKEKGMFWNKLKGDYTKFNSFALERMKKNPSILGVMYDNRLATKALLLSSTKKVRERIQGSGDSSLISLYKNWQQNREHLVKLYQLPSNSSLRAKINLDSLEQATNDIEKQLSKKSELFSKEYDSKSIGWKDIQKTLKRKEAAIEIIRFKKYGMTRNIFKPEELVPGYTDTVYFAALIITRKTRRHPKLVLLENGNELEKMYARQYRRSKDFEYLDQDSYDAFWSKISKKLRGIKRIYISLDGIFNNINLSSIFDTKKGKYLIDLMDIRIVTNTKDIVKPKEKDSLPANNTAVLIGRPTYYIGPPKARPYVTPLPGTKEEVKTIAIMMESNKWHVDVLLGKNASEEAVKKIQSPRVLHIATHGVFVDVKKSTHSRLINGEIENFEENPLLRSMLLFARAENTILENGSGNADTSETIKEDGLLTAYEAMSLDLDNTELVVLSACETGRGTISNGEGVYGLQRAFQVAGAKTIIMSLWNVSDRATQDLMSSFYEKWLAGADKREAFRAAQLEMKKKYKKFKYWGAFVMVGE